MNMNETKAASNNMSLAALIFGILAVLGSFTVVLTPVFAGLAITFSWLSRGDKRMCTQAVVGNVLGVIAIVISIIVLIAIVMVIASVFVMTIEGGGMDMETIPDTAHDVFGYIAGIRGVFTCLG